jgi:hypothetical protein
VKKGRHRRFEEARALKRSNSSTLGEVLDARDAEPCAECGGIYGLNEASWCPGAPECEAATRAQGAFGAVEDEWEDEWDEESEEADVDS